MRTFVVRTSGRWIVAVVLIGLLLPASRAEETPPAFDRADDALERAKRVLRPRAEPAEILAAFDAATASLDALAAPRKPELVQVAPDADEAESKQAADENKRRLTAWVRKRNALAKREAGLRAQWVDVLGEALTLQRLLRETQTNVHAEVNRKALALLSETGRSDAAGKITATLEEEWLRFPDFLALSPLVGAALEALSTLDSPEAFDWLRCTFVGKERDLPGPLHRGRKRTPPDPTAETVDVPLLALQAIARHEHMPGKPRYRMARDLVAAYAPLEERAAGGQDVRLWDHLRAAAIAATWHQAGEPRDEAGEPLLSMAGLAKWFRRHRDPRNETWAD